MAPLDAPIPVRSHAEFNELIEGSPIRVLVDFWAAWCGPCAAVAPELEKIARSHAGRLVVAKLDTDELPELAARFAIRSIPTMVLLHLGREEARLSGALSAPAILSRFGLPA